MVDAFEDAEVARRVVLLSKLPVVRFGIEKQAFLSNSDRFQDRGGPEIFQTMVPIPTAAATITFLVGLRIPETAFEPLR